jgi:hypothetical protein
LHSEAGDDAGQSMDIEDNAIDQSDWTLIFYEGAAV